MSMPDINLNVSDKHYDSAMLKLLFSLYVRSFADEAMLLELYAEVKHCSDEAVLKKYNESFERAKNEALAAFSKYGNLNAK